VKELAERVLYDVQGYIAVITLNRPDRLNAFDSSMYDGVNQALCAFRDDDSARVCVIQANGERAFSAGADVTALSAKAADGDYTGLGELLLDTEMLTAKPIIAAVHGFCVGEGVNLALSCDMIIAASSAKFMISEARIGINAVDIPIKLGKKIGYNKAFVMLHPGDAMPVEWCRDAGLVEIVVPDEELRATALLFAGRIADECGPLAVQAQKEVLWRAQFEDEDNARQVGRDLKADIRKSHDNEEGRTAFREKRAPQFVGK
jgi:enoyl-CoA hydratase